MRVAVVILNWNGEAHLRRFLPTVVAASPEADVIVADNGSTDASVQYVEECCPTVRLLLLGQNYGFAEGYNRALAQLEGYDLFVLLNSDVEPAEGWLAPLVECFADERTAIVGPKIRAVSAPDSFEYAGAAGGFIDYLGYPFCRGRIMNAVERDSGQYDTPREAMWVSGAALCCRADVYRELGGLCGDFFAHMEEIDLCWRVWLSGRKVVVEPRSTVYHLGGGTLANGSPQKVFLNHRNNLAMLYRCAPPVQRAVVAVVRPLLDALAALSYLAHGNVAGLKAVCRAYCDFARWHGRLARERRKIRGSAVAEAQGVYCGSMVLRYIFGGRTFNNMM